MKKILKNIIVFLLMLLVSAVVSKFGYLAIDKFMSWVFAQDEAIAYAIIWGMQALPLAVIYFVIYKWVRKGD